MKRLLLSLWLLLLLVVPGQGVEQKKVAVLDFRNEAELPQREVDYITNLARNAALQVLPASEFIILTKENITELLPPGTDLAKCVGGQCEVEIGRNIGADYLVWGEIVLFGGELRVTMRLYDTRSGGLLASGKASGAQVLDLEKPVEEETASLYRKIPLPVSVTPAPALVVQPMEDMAFASGGSYKMGCSAGDPKCRNAEEPAHTVKIRSFWIDKTEVTNDDYARCVDAGGCSPIDPTNCYPFQPRGFGTVHKLPAAFKQRNHPVVCGTWEHALNYCRWKQRRLPTEAEWEYAARAGSSEPTYFELDSIAWYGEDTWESAPHTIGLKRPNALGLFDMLGNVWEWCADFYDDEYYISSPIENPTGPPKGWERVIRGAAFDDPAKHVRVSKRFGYDPNGQYSNVGFRCAKDAEQGQ